MDSQTLPTRAAALEAILEEISASPSVIKLRESLQVGDPPRVEFARAAGSLPRFIAAALVRDLGRTLLYVAHDIRAAERARDDLRTLLGDHRVVLLPPRHAIPYDPLHQNHRFDERAAVFERLTQGDFDVLIAVPPSLVERYEPLAKASSKLIRFAVGDEIDREALALILSEGGMRREVRAEEPGQFAVRGAVIDIFPPAAEDPVRLELWGDEITDMRAYDPQTQRSLDPVKELTFYAGEGDHGGDSPGEEGIWTLMPEGTVAFFDDRDAISDGLDRHWEEVEYQFEKRRELEIDKRTPRPDELYFRAETVLEALELRPHVVHRGIASSTKGAISLDARSHESFLGDLNRLGSYLRNNRERRIQSFVLSDRESQVDRLADLLAEHGGADDAARMGVAPIHEGFYFPDVPLDVLTDHQIFGRHKRTAPFRRRSRKVDATLFKELKKGDLVVHTDFGIGRYLGLKKIQIGGVERELIQVEYRDNVKVYVRLDQFGKLQKYQGTDEGGPKLSKIGGADWERARQKTEAATEELAAEILEIYAQRQVQGGHAFSTDTPWQREMEAAFEFEDTPDQALAVDQVKRDMEQPIAMDRLLLGDVGFGKTEVAVRAAFKALQDGKQVAVLCPTTILAQQHYATFTERLRRYPIKVEVLSRFRSRKQQNDTLSGLTSGAVDLVIGTHRLLSTDVNFKDLGLMIVDEEHRFGVRHKDRLKKLRASVDVLTLSATPIPRTLHMALSGARDMSMISTPPQDRLPIETEVVPYDERVIREAIMREIARGGQVYFVHNRVQTIYNVQKMLQKLLPDVTFGVAHGQMKEMELEKVMNDFLHEKYQVLVTTMIIESGLDIPNVNTLIVNRADTLGLAQLYQLRGRIGRSHRQAYAYLLTPPRMVLTPEARKRLETIAEHTRLGSGFQIAMRDLEIRGAGNLLGPQQSGFINAVGFEMYTEMLGEAVQKLSEERDVALPEAPPKRREIRDVQVDVPVDAMLPADYVADSAERVELYRRLSRARSAAEVHTIRDELRDRFGPLPGHAVNLLHIVEAQTYGAAAGISKVDVHEEVAFLNFVDEWGEPDFEAQIGALMRNLADLPIELRGTGPLGLRVDLSEAEDWPQRWSLLHAVLDALPLDQPWAADEEGDEA